MKFLPFLSIVLFGLILSVSACGGESDAKSKARESLGDVQSTPPPPPTANQPGATTAVPPPAEPAQNAKGVWHFTCAKGCAGGGGSAADKCAGCDGPLAHNQEYHAQ